MLKLLRAGTLTSILHFDAQQEQVRQLGDMNRADAALTQEARPVMLEVLVKDAVADVVREKVLHLDGRAQAERDARVDSARGQVSAAE